MPELPHLHPKTSRRIGRTFSGAILLGLVAVLLLCSIGACPACSSSPVDSNEADNQTTTPSVSRIDTLGFSGGISSAGALTGSLREGGPEFVFLSTDDGLYAISEGSLRWWQLGVQYMALTNDITGDGARDLVASRGSRICCYDGVTGDLVWQMQLGQLRVFHDGLGWGTEDLYVMGLQVGGSEGSQIVVVRSTWCVLGIGAQDGRQLWRLEFPDGVDAMAVVSDNDGDGIDEFVVGSVGGRLSSVDLRTGRAKWTNETGKGRISSIAGQGSGVVIGTGNGTVCMIDVHAGDLRWENQVVDGGYVGAQMVPDVTGDALAEVMAIKPTDRGSPHSVALLSGADGSALWTSQMYTDGSAVATVEGRPVLLEPNPQLGIRVVSLKDGSLDRSFTVVTQDGQSPQIRQMSDGSLVAFSDGSDLTVIAADGAVQWAYPRVNSVAVKKGRFNREATPDILVCGQSAQPADQATATRLISAIDGTTTTAIWRFEVPWVDFATLGGLNNVEIAGDLTGDGIQDVLACRGSMIFLFSGADGNASVVDIGETVTFLKTTEVGDGATAIVAGTEESLMILDKDGNRLWESACTDWSPSKLGLVEVLNDLNQDNIGDLVLAFADRIEVLASTGGNPLGFEMYRSLPHDDNATIALKELTNDIDGDGVQEIAYCEYEGEQSPATGNLLVLSPVSGKVWHRWDMPVTVDLACADFDGDGYLDSLVHRQLEEATQSDSGLPGYPQTRLEIYSGKGGDVLWTLTFNEDRWETGSNKMPAVPAGDITGDGVEDLAVSSVLALGDGSYSASMGMSEFFHETHLSVYDIASDTLVREVVLPPAQKDGRVATDEGHYGRFEPVSGPGDAVCSAGDLNEDGHREQAVLAGYLPSGSSLALAGYPTGGGHFLALVDSYNQRLLAYFTSLPALVFFEADERAAIGFSIGGSVYLARVNSDLRVTSPAEEATVGSHARIAWEGSADWSTASVFVDGYESARTSGNEVTVPIKPGSHEVVVRSIDDYGVVRYAAVEFSVRGSHWVSILAVAAAVTLLALYFATRVIDVIRCRRARRQET